MSMSRDPAALVAKDGEVVKEWSRAMLSRGVPSVCTSYDVSTALGIQLRRHFTRVYGRSWEHNSVFDNPDANAALIDTCSRC